MQNSRFKRKLFKFVTHFFLLTLFDCDYVISICTSFSGVGCLVVGGVAVYK